jgi:hypothetical protein
MIAVIRAVLCRRFLLPGSYSAQTTTRYVHVHFCTILQTVHSLKVVNFQCVMSFGHCTMVTLRS